MAAEQFTGPPSEEAVPSTAGEAPSPQGAAIEEAAEAGPQLGPIASAQEAKVQASLLMHQLAAERIRRGLSQKEVAGRAGTNQGRISEIERGKARPSYDLFMRHVMGLGGRVVILFDDLPEQEENSTGDGGGEQSE